METVYKNASGDHVLRRALKMVTSVCPDNVTIETDLNVGQVCILCNETQINQVILNICVNAIQAIGHREDGKLRVTARVADREELTKVVTDEIPETWERYMKVDISDNGCGMSDEVLRQIFDPFFTTKKGERERDLDSHSWNRLSAHTKVIFRRRVCRSREVRFISGFRSMSRKKRWICLDRKTGMDRQNQEVLRFGFL